MHPFSDIGFARVVFEPDPMISRLKYKLRTKSLESYSKLETYFYTIFILLCYYFLTITTHSMPSEKDGLLVSDERYAIVNDAVVCICKVCDDRHCVVNISHSWLLKRIYLMLLSYFVNVMKLLLLKIACSCVSLIKWM